MDNTDLQGPLGSRVVFEGTDLFLFCFCFCLWICGASFISGKFSTIGIYQTDTRSSLRHTHINSRYPFGDLDTRDFLCETFLFDYTRRGA